MKRNAIDILRRGLDNTIANRGLIVVRLVETLVFAAIAVLTVLVVLLPIAVSVGIEVSQISSPEDLESALLNLMQKWILLVWIFVAVSVVVLIFVALHAFVEAGCARVYVDGERMAGPAAEGERSRFHVFSVERWYTGAKDGWWPVFWIYNFAWGVAGLIFLIPLLPTLIVTLVFRETPAVAITGGCIGLLVTVMLMIVVGFVTGMWTERAIVNWAAHRTTASAALADAWQSIKRDLGRHLLVAVAMIVIAIAGSSIFASFSYLAAFGQMMNDSAAFAIATMPLRMAGMFFNSIFSAIVSSWYLASYAALAVEDAKG
ncbi:MAG TPA: hypothetical protein VF883_07150 [Thermoanaerobaculia bacterium]|jgi:hypothetical protein